MLNDLRNNLFKTYSHDVYSGSMCCLLDLLYEIAEYLHASENHLSKVLQRLAHSGIVRSTRGPRGGFRIRSPWEKIKLIDIYEAIEGPVTPARCLLELPACKGNRCTLGVLIHKTDKAVRKCLTGTTLAEMAKSFRPGA